MPSILFAHQNFPAQFGFIGGYLANNGWDVQFATAREDPILPENTTGFKFKAHRDPNPDIHPYLTTVEKGILNGQGFARSAVAAKKRDFNPDIIMAHSGWGTGHFAKAIWPDAVFVPYLEWWYSYPAVDQLEEDIKWDGDVERIARNLIRNTPILTDIGQSKTCLSPTEFQRSQFPEHLQHLIHVMHDGVDCDAHKPDPHAKFTWQDRVFHAGSKTVTFVSRGLEPQRGFPQFMRALAPVMANDPDVNCIIVGEDRVAYGSQLPDGDSWKKRMLSELEFDHSRLIFTGLLPRAQYRKLLQVSALHVHLSVPFCLSWSLTEAMATACPLIVAENAAMAEAIDNGVHGSRVNMSDVEAITRAITDLLEDKEKAHALGEAARARIVEKYATKVIYPAKDAWLRGLIKP